MAQTVNLHGGPWHGRTTAVQEGRDHFHIIEPEEPLASLLTDEDIPTSVKTREGMYSRIHNSKTEFEWDGWRSHD